MDCPICFNKIYDKYITDCNHEFCSPCLDKWFDRGHKDCPICRTNIKYLNNGNISIRLISINDPIIIERQLPENYVAVRKKYFNLLFLGTIFTTISFTINLYLLYE